MKTTPPPITPLEMTEAEIELAEQAAARLGYTQWAYTSTSAIWGLFVLPENPKNRHGQVTRGGVFFKTAEFGIVFLQDMEDLHCEDLVKENGAAKLVSALPPPCSIQLLVGTLRKAYNELNIIRARDGIPYCHDGRKSDVDPDYFNSVVEECRQAIEDSSL